MITFLVSAGIMLAAMYLTAWILAAIIIHFTDNKESE